MKAAVFVLGTFSFSTIGLGSLFKILHWPGANILLVLGLSVFSVLFVPSLAKYLYDKRE